MHTNIVLQALTHTFLRRLVATPRGRQHVLNQLADAESNGESAIFDRLLAQVDDPELQKMVAKHADDEIRHAQLFRGCLARNGGTATEVPPHLRMIDILDKEVGNVFDRGIQSRQDIMEAYVLLQVVEERAVEQFGQMEPAFRLYDPQTADVISEIAKDEERHLKYCVAIAKRYAPSTEIMESTLRRYRKVEGEVFGRVSRANMLHALDHQLLVGGEVENLAWRGVHLLGNKANKSQPTRFWDSAALGRLSKSHWRFAS